MTTDATWTTANEQSDIDLRADNIIRAGLIEKADFQESMGVVSWGGYIFHVYKEVMEKHSIELSEYAVPGQSVLGYRVQNKINQPSEVILDTMMVSSGTKSIKQMMSASFAKGLLENLEGGGMQFIGNFLDVTPWVVYPLNIGGIMNKLKEAMYKGWALPYNGKYGRIENMALISVESLDNEETVYGCPLRLHLKQVLGINHRAVGRKVSSCTVPMEKL